jgi:Na+/proline symporter
LAALAVASFVAGIVAVALLALGVLIDWAAFLGVAFAFLALIFGVLRADLGGGPVEAERDAAPHPYRWTAIAGMILGVVVYLGLIALWIYWDSQGTSTWLPGAGSWR